MQDITKTSQEPTSLNGGDGLTCSQEGFRASPSLWPDEERERKTTATSGRTCCVRYTKSGPLGLLARTLLESSRWFSPARRLKWEAKPLYLERVTLKEHRSGRNTSSRPSAVTLSARDIPSSRLLYRLVPSARPTEGTGCGLWQDLLPTPRVTEIVEDPDKFVQRKGDRKPGCMPNLSSMAAYRADLLPTPNASEGEKYTVTYNPKSQMGKSLTAIAVNGLLPTPTATDSGTGRINRSPSPNAKERPTLALAARMGLPLTPSASDGMRATMTMESLKKKNKPNAENSNLAEQIAHRTGGGDSRLNPLFVAEMMGFPVAWTVLPFQSGGTNP